MRRISTRSARRIRELIAVSPPSGSLVEKLGGTLRLAPLANAIPKIVRRRQRSRRRHAGAGSHEASGAHDLAARCGAVHHAAAGHYQRSAHRTAITSECIACRSSNARETRDALAAPQTGSRACRRLGRKSSGRGRDRHRSGADVRRHRAAAAVARRVRVCRFAARQAGGARSARRRVDLMVPADAEFVLEGYVDNEDCASRGRSAIIPASTVSRIAIRRFTLTCITHRRDPIYAGDRRRQTADGGRVARKGDGTHLLAAAASDAARSRRYESSGRRRISQSRHRLDSQVVSRSSQEGHERAVGPRPHDDADARA